jgi:hypothetical protein
MSEQPVNPYSAPQSGQSTPGTSIELLPLWIWLAVAVLTAWIATPADPLSLILSLAYGLICFWAGIVLGSRINLVLRLLPLSLWCAFEIWSLVSISPDADHPGWQIFFLVVSVCYGSFSIAFGAWSFRSIQYGRLRILAIFSLGYILGTLFGPLGTVVGAVLSTIFARRSFPRPTSEI